MFTGIIETTGVIKQVKREYGNLYIQVSSKITPQLRIDQSIAHNGVCLTVVNIAADIYSVIAISETLNRTNLGELKQGDSVNLERCLSANGRFDGHIVQGHVDTTAVCSGIEIVEGSWRFTFGYEPTHKHHLTVEKGSICVNGVSLTVVDSNEKSFSVAIIPYTFEHTNFKYIREGDKVNLEFDIIGKYISSMLEHREV
jgi:riboflavin synthase